MKPTFALDLTEDSIGLLHRTPEGWLPIGEVAFAAPDMAEALSHMRQAALDLSPEGFSTKVVIPNSQVLYTEIEAPGPRRGERRKQIIAALEELTPYKGDELVFDWSGSGSRVKVAAVAKETLAEAEAFAVEHQMNVVSFVAAPDPGVYDKEPWFGASDAAPSILPAGEKVERDQAIVTRIGREPPVEAAPEEEPHPEPAAEVPVEEPVVADEPLPEPEIAELALAPDEPVDPGPLPEPEPAPVIAADPAAEPEVELPAAEMAEPAPPEEPKRARPLAFAGPRAK
ncbi:MAG: translation initiation factor 2, partial [Tabrizicola sp.]|nr:translation initiation factor 2 [Tabrizicola sp.]